MMSRQKSNQLTGKNENQDGGLHAGVTTLFSRAKQTRLNVAQAVVFLSI